MMRIGPHMKDYKEVPTDKAYPDAKAYEVTDIMDMLPKGLWSSNVVSTYYHTDRDDGVFMVIKAPLDVVMDTYRVIKQEGDDLVLSEDVEIRCSRLFRAFGIRGKRRRHQFLVWWKDRQHKGFASSDTVREVQ